MQSSVPYPDRPHRALVRTVFILLAAVAGGCSGNGDGFLPIVFERPETAVSYKVVLEGSPSDEITALAEQSLASYRLRAKGAASLAFLRRRAESDRSSFRRADGEADAFQIFRLARNERKDG